MGSPRRAVRRRAAVAFAAALAIPILAAGCSEAARSPRPTDPHVIVTDAVKATAALPSVRLHLEMVSTIAAGAFGGNVAGRTSSVIDADVDLATRQLAGRTTSTMTGGGAMFAGQGAQTADVIVTANETFVRPGAGRWTKSGGGGLQIGPSNAAIVTAIVGLLDDPRVTYELAEGVECSLGPCDHVIVHVSGPAAFAAMAGLAGMPNDAAAAAGVPNVDLDVRVAQSNSVIGELRLGFSMGGQSTQVLVALTNPGEPVQIVAPPPALVDDMTGGQVNKILETVGDEIATPVPDLPSEPPAAP
jgi:hypothetical protein